MRNENDTLCVCCHVEKQVEVQWFSLNANVFVMFSEKKVPQVAIGPALKSVLKMGNSTPLVQNERTNERNKFQE